MSLAATILQDIRTQYPSNLDRDELRITRNGLLTAAREMTNSPDSIISGDLRNQALTSEGRNLDIPVMNKGGVTISNTRACTISASDSSSDLVRVTWRTLVGKVEMTPAQYATNELGYMEDLNKKIRETVEKFNTLVEAELETTLDANKTTVYGSPLVGTGAKYELAGGAIQVVGDQSKLFFNDLEAINYEDDFYGTVRVAGSPSLMPYVNEYINQGGGNSTNLNFQFAGKNFGFTNRISAGAGKNASFYFMPDGTLGFLTRVDINARTNARSTRGTEWFQDNLPGLDHAVGVKYYSECADENGKGAHLTSTLKEFWEFSFDYAILTPYNSDASTKAGSIRKVDFAPAV
jgi:hypothetical protein